MPSRRANRVTTRGRNNSQQLEDVTEVGSNQPNNAHGIPSRRHNGVSSRGRNNSHQSEDVTEVGSNQPNNPHVPVPGNAWKRVRGPTMMPKVWTKTEEDRISVQFNEYGQPVKDTTSTLSHFIGSLARSGKYCKLHKPMVILGREPTRKELFRACFSKDEITQNVEVANAIEQTEESTPQLSEHELAESRPQDIYSKIILNSEIIAKGWIRSLDPDEVVGSEEINVRSWLSVFDFIVFYMPENVKVSLILRRPFLSTTHAKIDVFKGKIALRLGNDKIVFKSDNPTSNIIKTVYVLGLRERMELDLESRLIGEALILDRSHDPEFGDFFDLNELLELRRNQDIDALGPIIEEGECSQNRMIGHVNMVTHVQFYAGPSGYGLANSYQSQ
ncbi:hypothetical protein Tco_0719410 [Tanacetum coccineum]